MKIDYNLINVLYLIKVLVFSLTHSYFNKIIIVDISKNKGEEGG